MRTYSFTVCYAHFNDSEKEGYSVTVPMLPGCITWGHTLEEARGMAEEAIQGYLESLQGDDGSVESAEHPVVVERLVLNV